MRTMPTSSRIAHLRQYAIDPHLRKSVLLSPLLGHFLAANAKLYGISESEFLRRVLFDMVEKWMQAGLYRIPDELLSTGETPVPKPTPSTIRNLKQYRNTPDRPPSDVA
jgi:hypothetical protein